MPDRERRPGTGKEALGALAVGVLAVGCCAGLPLLVALAGSVVAATLLGAAGAIVGAIVLAALAASRVRTRRRRCDSPDPGRSARRSRRTTEHP